MSITTPDQISATVLALELGINERWNRGDVGGALEIYADDVSYFDPLTERRLDGKLAVAAYFYEVFDGKLNILRNELPNPEIIVSAAGDMAVATYNLLNFVSDGDGGEKAGTVWNSTQVYRLVDGSWKVVHVNWSFARHPAALDALLA